tara:strand:+ start:1047 stop:1427 length:381 start_codon:yes stop_codon:yes gene_type:complete
MFLAALEPGKEIAIANFFLAIFCLFTFLLPLLLNTRGDKTEANRDFPAATVNPWYQVAKEAKLVPVVESEFTSSVKLERDLKVVSYQNFVAIQESGEIISLEIKRSDELDLSSTQLLANDDELLAA